MKSTFHAAFEAALRNEVAGWSRPPADLVIDLPIAELPLVAWMDLVVDGVAIMTIGAHVAGSLVVCDQLHSQLMTLPATPTAIAFRAEGGAGELARRVADWFRGVIDRGYARQEWVHRGAVYAQRYVVADLGEPLAESYDYMRAPRTLRLRGPHGVRVRDLGQPDRVVPVKVEY